MVSHVYNCCISVGFEVVNIFITWLRNGGVLYVYEARVKAFVSRFVVGIPFFHFSVVDMVGGIREFVWQFTSGRKFQTLIDFSNVSVISRHFPLV